MGVIRAGFTGGFIGIVVSVANLLVESTFLEKLSAVGLYAAGYFGEVCTSDCSLSENFTTIIATILGNCATYFVIGVLVSLGISVIKMWLKPKKLTVQPPQIPALQQSQQTPPQVVQSMPQSQTPLQNSQTQQPQQTQVQTVQPQPASAEIHDEAQQLEEFNQDNSEELEKEITSKQSKIKKADLERMPVYDENKKQWTVEIKGDSVKSKQSKSAKKKPVKKASPKKSKPVKKSKPSKKR